MLTSTWLGSPAACGEVTTTAVVLLSQAIPVIAAVTWAAAPGVAEQLLWTGEESATCDQLSPPLVDR
ncbi:MAG: hypothetical protein V9E83_12800 [Baekduia sp.]